jgi:hypothetical protein
LDEFVARINAGGRKEARGGLQAIGLRVFPSFITAIFIDDVLWRFHHPYAHNGKTDMPYIFSEDHNLFLYNLGRRTVEFPASQK